MKNKLIVLSGFVLGLAPVVALAANTSTSKCQVLLDAKGGAIEDIPTLLCKIGQIFNGAVPILIALAVLIFVIGVVQYVIANDEEAKKKGRARMIYGIVGLAVIVALFGLVNILTNTFGLQDQQDISFPQANI